MLRPSIVWCLLALLPYRASLAADEAPVFWGEVDGQPVYLYTLTNTNGMVMKMTDYGAKIVELHVPDKEGGFDDVVLGFNNRRDLVMNILFYSFWISIIYWPSRLVIARGAPLFPWKI